MNLTMPGFISLALMVIFDLIRPSVSLENITKLFGFFKF